MIFNELFASDKEVSLEDITLVYCIRLGEHNPWVLERLLKLKGYLDPQPTILVLDYGSETQYAEKILKTCEDACFKYVFVDTRKGFSNGVARNIAASYVETDYIFFNDIDCFFEKDFFYRVMKAVKASRIDKKIDTILSVPVYHLTEDNTKKSLDFSKERFSDFLSDVGFRSEFESKTDVQYIAPYSNVFLIKKDFFVLVGGYNESFVGHGSEDFEFFVRSNFYSNYFPVPENIAQDVYGPLKPEFYADKGYIGFRALNSLHAISSQHLGLKTFHLWHPIKTQDDWRVKNDWKRTRFNNELGSYVNSNENLLGLDFLSKEKIAVCVCKHKDQWAYFLPLRLLGYKIIPVFDDQPSTLKLVSDYMDSNSIDLYCIFNPYMKSHAAFLPLFFKAKDVGVETLVVERGAFPNTLYYAEDVAYNSKKFSPDYLEKLSLSASQKEKACDYVMSLRNGSNLLESSSDKEQTCLKYSPIFSGNRKKILIPFQLSDDMAVTKYTAGFESYEKFEKDVADVAIKNPEILFLVKPHPLSKNDYGNMPENVLIAAREDNIHALIDLADAVVCYNSGVGFLGIAHQKPVITVGNAYYNVNGVGYKAGNISEAVELFKSGVMSPLLDSVIELVGKYLFKIYSFFTAEDDIKEFVNRKAHNYKSINVVAINVFEEHKLLTLRKNFGVFSAQSYNMAMLNFSGFDKNKRLNRLNKKRPAFMCPDGKLTFSPDVRKFSSNSIHNVKGVRAYLLVLYMLLAARFIGKNKKKMLLNDPVGYFEKHGKKSVRAIGATIFKGKGYDF